MSDGSTSHKAPRIVNNLHRRDRFYAASPLSFGLVVSGKLSICMANLPRVPAIWSQRRRPGQIPFFRFDFDAASASELGQRWGAWRHWSKTHRRGHPTPLEKQSRTQQRQIRNDTLSLALCASKRKMRRFCSPLQRHRTRHTHPLSVAHITIFPR